MKRLIVLPLLVTLLALQSGCSILNPRVTEPCDATSPLRSRMGQFRLKNLLPWRSDNSEECCECNEGFSEVGYSDGQVIEGQMLGEQIIDGQVFEGQVIDGGYVDSSYTAGYPVATDLYKSDVIFEPPVVEAPIPTRPISGQPEQIPAPAPY